MERKIKRAVEGNLEVRRREYVKYAGAGIAAVVVAAAGVYYFGRTEPTVTPTASSTYIRTLELRSTVTPTLGPSPTPMPTATATKTIERSAVEIYAIKKGVYNNIDKRILRELSKLPDYQKLEGNAESLDFLFDLATDEKNKEQFYQMFAERLDMKKIEYQNEPYPYCSQLEALDWIGRDSQSMAERYLKEYHERGLDNLISYAWRKTSTSDNYKSNKWTTSDNKFKKYYEVRNRLNLDLLLRRYMRDNISYEKDYDHYWQFPHETFIRGKGDCEDHASFAVDCLRNSGHNSLVLSILWQEKSETDGHSICVTKTPTSGYWIFDNALWKNQPPFDKIIKGPFQRLRASDIGTGDSVETDLTKTLNNWGMKVPPYGYSISLSDQYGHYVSSF